ncbi:DUF1444 family protein [Sporolactobacillus spathodeae]|uniref:Uncharacterized protein YtpQ (UPF0354 family) n=1 Tax=Sporolactobacillus spathodeae TaxID=1465502 RepID=A0ABS2QAY2_9BACL|nr:uncharacterized protein YtpQ (UPF0354 family) [Sporolactobacillus spathodeae]
MNLRELQKQLTECLSQSGRQVTFDRTENKIRVKEVTSSHEVTLVLPELLKKYANNGEQALEACVRTVDQAFAAMRQKAAIGGNENSIFPVIRPASFPEQLPDGRRLLVAPHTAETKIFYALDLGGSYRLLDELSVQSEGFRMDTIKELALDNLEKLPTESKKDVVRNNVFHFINYSDGYDASRILNRKLLRKMRDQAKGDLACAIPHQDVLIFADLVNPEGYDILAQMMLKFYAAADNPITLLPFLCHPDELEPLFIMAKRRPRPIGPERR